jgi:chromosome partitioning protein
MGHDDDEPLIATTTANEARAWQGMRVSSSETSVKPMRSAVTAADMVNTQADRTDLTDLVGDETPIMRQAEAAMLLQRRGVDLPAPADTRVMVVANQKGGVGKTTCAVNLAAALAVCGLRVLVVDLDPQGNATTALGINRWADRMSIYDALIDDVPFDEIVAKVERYDSLYCVPATIDLAGSEIELVAMEGRESRLKNALRAHLKDASGNNRYDYVFIDCPPSLGLLTVNALVGGNEVLIPIQCEYYALEGVTQLLQNIKLVQSHLNPGLVVSTVLLTMFDGRTRLSAQVVDDVREHFGDAALRTMIPRSVRVSEAPSFGQTVMTHDPGSSGAMSYLDAARELAERGSTDA